MKKLLISALSIIVPLLSFGQTPTIKDLINKLMSVVNQVAPEYRDTWEKMIRLSNNHGGSEYFLSALPFGELSDSYSVLDSLDKELLRGNTSCVDSLRAVVVPISQTMANMALAMVPSFQGIEIDGTVENLVLLFEKKGWKDHWLQNLTEQELAQAGYTLKQLHQQSGGMVVLDGYFRRKTAQLLLWPVSEENNNVAYIALSMEYSETNLRAFEKYDLMPLVEEYARKYGEYKITPDSGRYANADSYTSSYSFSPQEILLYVHFDIPSVSMRVQVADNHKYKIIVYYLNGYSFGQSENFSNDEI